MQFHREWFKATEKGVEERQIFEEKLQSPLFSTTNQKVCIGKVPWKLNNKKQTQKTRNREYQKREFRVIYDFSSQIHKIKDFGIWVHEAFDQIKDLE